MLKVLLTGMSGVGKSTVLKQLKAEGFLTVDLDSSGWINYDVKEEDYLMDTAKIIDFITLHKKEIIIGLDTVELDGEGFEKFVEADEKVQAGQKLVSFDIDLIKERGYSIQTPVVVTNSNAYEDVLFSGEASVERGDYLITTIK